jgi:hypothetical protein
MLYAEIFTHHVGRIGSPSRRTVFIRKTNTTRYKVPNIPSRNSMINIIQKGSAGFKATINLNKKQSTPRCSLDLLKECRLNFSKAKA